MKKIRTADEMGEFARAYLADIRPRSAATVVALSGDLGAGKTTFAQEIAKALGVTESVTSPTFVIEKVYPLTEQKWQRLVHIDAYRLKSAHELEVLGWDELIADSANLILIEWPERVEKLIPRGAARITFDIHEEERSISINGQEKKR